MSLALLHPATATASLAMRLGASVASDEGLCELLRAEVHARGQAQRALTLNRVGRRIGPVMEIAAERLDALCEALVREGDLVLGPGGILWPTPLRVVPLAGGVARLYSSLPRAALTLALGRPPAAQGATRTIAWEDALSAAVAATGGVVLTAATWAGLDRAPRANDALLAQLDERLAWEPEPPGSLERDGPLEWRGWAPGGDHAGWRRDAAGAKLWWAQARGRGQHRAWTAGEGSPSVAAFIELSADEADRARFALSNQAGSPAILGVEIMDGFAILEIPGWLPRPEYRWLSLQAEAVGALGQTTRWRLSRESGREVADQLATRLGLQVELR